MVCYHQLAKASKKVGEKVQKEKRDRYGVDDLPVSEPSSKSVDETHPFTDDTKATSHRWRYYLVREDLLPEAMVKTAQAKHLLARGAVTSVLHATRMVGLSRSAFYKYKDGVFWYDAMHGERIYVLSMNLDHQRGVLSQVLGVLAELGANILTIHQTIPLQEVANVTISLELSSDVGDEEMLLARLRTIHGVSRLEIVGRGMEQ